MSITQTVKVLKMRGNLRVERAGVTRIVALDVDLKRNTSQTLLLVSARAVVMGENAFPIERLRLTPSCRGGLVLSGISTLAQLPKDLPSLRRIGLKDDDLRGLLDALRSLGYVVERGQTLRWRTATPTAQSYGWLIDWFLSQPVKALGLSPGTLIRLSLASVRTVKDLTERTVGQLRKATVSDSQLREIERQLAHYGLRLVTHEEVMTRAWMQRWEERAARLKVRATNQVSLEEARQILGQQFELFYRLREAKTTAERIAWRNAIVVANRGLAGRAAAMSIPELKRQEDPALDFDDLFQEACIGLMYGTSTYDLTYGFKPSTYLIQWARQAVTRHLADMTIWPVHMVERFAKLNKVYRALRAQGNTAPTVEELAAAMELTAAQVEQLLIWKRLGWTTHARSLDEATLEEGDELGDAVPSPFPEWAELKAEGDENLGLRQEVADVLATAPLLPVEREILELRFGFRGGECCTLEAISERYGVTRERIRQIEERALEQLRTSEVFGRFKGFGLKLQPPTADISDALWHDACDCWEHLRQSRQSDWTPTQVVEMTAAYFERTPHQVRTAPQAGRPAAARYVAVAFCLAELGSSPAPLAELFGLPLARLQRMRLELEEKFSQLTASPAAEKTPVAAPETAPEAGERTTPQARYGRFWDDQRLVAQALLEGGQLEDRERELLQLRYGLGGSAVCTLREIAPKFGVSFQRVYQIHQRLFDHLPVLPQASRLLPHWATAVDCWSELRIQEGYQSIGIPQAFELTAAIFHRLATQSEATITPALPEMVAAYFCLSKVMHPPSEVARFLGISPDQIPAFLQPMRRFFQLFGAALREQHAPRPGITPDIQEVIDRVADRWGFSPTVLQDPSQPGQTLAEARAEAVWQLRSQLRLGFNRMAKLLGYADQNAVLQAFTLARQKHQSVEKEESSE